MIEAGRRHDTFCRALVRRGGKQTKIEWVFDSAFRFFPVEPDPDLGWRLNFWDVAVNKVLAFAGRPEIRDWVDVLHLHGRHLHLGALAWAGTGKDPGLSPEAIIRWGGRQAVYRPDDLADLILSEPVTLPQLKERWLEASSAALELIARLPLDEVGCLYLDRTGKPVCPDPAGTGLPQTHSPLRQRQRRLAAHRRRLSHEQEPRRNSFPEHLRYPCDSIRRRVIRFGRMAFAPLVLRILQNRGLFRRQQRPDSLDGCFPVGLETCPDLLQLAARGLYLSCPSRGGLANSPLGRRQFGVGWRPGIPDSFWRSQFQWASARFSALR